LLGREGGREGGKDGGGEGGMYVRRRKRHIYEDSAQRRRKTKEMKLKDE